MCENNFYQYPARFLNIRRLDLHCSLNEIILSALLRLDRLHSLDIVIRNDFSYSLFETFINQAPHRYSLKLKYFNDLPMEIFRIKTKSIQRIDLIGNSIYHIRYLNSIEGEILSNSLLGKQCKILLINVENRIDIIEFINKILNLRSLIVRCKDEKNNDKLNQWIQNHIPSACFMSRDQKDMFRIRLWLNK